VAGQGAHAGELGPARESDPNVLGDTESDPGERPQHWIAHVPDRTRGLAGQIATLEVAGGEAGPDGRPFAPDRVLGE
jgi:hypothetical protein